MAKKILSVFLVITIVITAFSSFSLFVTAEDISANTNYRNIALRRAAWHSTAIDYNQTAHLVTDGIYDVDESVVHVGKPIYTDQHGNSPSGETPDKAFDKSTSTKWLSTASSAWLQIELPDSFINLPATKYIIASGNDVPGRDPKSWTVQGSNDGVNFTDLDARENETWATRKEERSFEIANNTEAYKYYRLNILENSGDSRIQLSEFDMLDANGNSIFEKPDPTNDGEPVYSDQHNNSSQYETPDRVFDNKAATKWYTGGVTSAWIQIELPDSYINKPAVSYAITSGNDSPNRDPKKWTVQGSNDGIEFTDIDSREDELWTERKQERSFDITGNTETYKIYRLNIIENRSGSGIQLSEFNMFDADGNSIFTKIVDNFYSFWQSDEDGEQYIYIDLGENSSFDKVIIDWSKGYATRYDIQISDNAKDWSTVKSVTDGKGGKEEVAFDTVKAKYVRILLKESNSTAYVIKEVEVWGVNDINYTLDPIPAPEADGTQKLTGGNWKISRAGEVNSSGEELSSGSFDNSSWLSATVPGTALMSYLNAGAIPDPNFDDWQLQISDSYFTTSYWYTNSFNVPASQEGKTTWLNFDSINWKAKIYLNGQYVDKIDCAYIRTKLDVTDYIKYGEENYLAVFIQKNDNPGDVTLQSLASAGKNGGVLGADSPSILASIGWDWMPTIRGRNVGIYDEVYLSYTDDVQIRYPWIITDLDLGETIDPTDNLTNLAIGATATASTNENGTNIPSKAIDGDIDTRWASQRLDDQWFVVEFNEPTTFNSVIIDWQSAFSANYSIEYSNDGENYTTAKTIDECRAGVDIQVFDAVTAKYLRINMGKKATAYGHSFWELRVYNTEEENLYPINPTPDFSKTDITVKADISNTFDSEITATVKGVITPGNIEFSKEITLPANSVQEITIDGIVMENPQLWWPNTYGDQPLYNCELTAYVNDVASHKESFDFGVREYSYFTKAQLEIYCNGTRIIGRGGNWGMDDSNLAVNDEEYFTKVRMHAESNFTMIRNWVGMTGGDAFYEACDKYGILIFDDFWLANPNDGLNPNDDTLFLKAAMDKIKRTRKYTSLALYCGRNEGDPPSEINSGLKKYTSELDGTRCYIPNSGSGSVSGHGPYAVRDPKYYFENAPITLHSERGMANIPSIESIKLMLSEENLWPINDVWGIHDFCKGSAQGANNSLNEMKDYGFSSDSADSTLEEFVRVSQMVNYENHKALFEATFNKRGNGMLMWMSQSSWPSFVWQTYDYFYDTNAGYFALKTANQPVNAIWNCTSDEIILTNNTPNDLEALKVCVYMYDLNGKLIWSKDAVKDIKSDSNETVMTVEYPVGSTDVKFIKTFVYDESGEKIAEDFYWTNSATYQDYAALDTLDYVDVDASYSMLKKDGTTNYYTVNVANTTDTPALMIRVKTTNDLTGERVLPAYYEDNYFSLMPGESKQITVEFEEKYLNGGKAVFEVEGWNINEDVIEPAGSESFDAEFSAAAVTGESTSFTYSFTMSADKAVKGTFIVSLFDTDGSLVGIKTIPMTEEAVSFTSTDTITTSSEAVSYKVMLLNNLDTLKPLCKAKSGNIE